MFCYKAYSLWLEVYKHKQFLVYFQSTLFFFFFFFHILVLEKDIESNTVCYMYSSMYIPDRYSLEDLALLFQFK